MPRKNTKSEKEGRNPVVREIWSLLASVGGTTQSPVAYPGPHPPCPPRLHHSKPSAAALDMWNVAGGLGLEAHGCVRSV